MTPYRNRKTEATGPMAHDMQVRGFATRTIDSYTYHIDRMCRHFGKRPEDVTPEDIKEFQLWMLNVNESSWSQFNQAVRETKESGESEVERKLICPVCRQQGVDAEMQLIDFQRRPSWRAWFYGPDHPEWLERVHLSAPDVVAPQPRGSPQS